MIAFRNVTHGYGDGPLLSDVSLTLPPGSFHFLTGPSGAGKSTFLKLCYRELMPIAGTVEIFGQDVSHMSRDAVAMARRKIGVVHQDCQFLDHLPLADNVALPLTVAGREANTEELKELLAWVGLSGHAKARPPSLSGGGITSTTAQSGLELASPSLTTSSKRSAVGADTAGVVKDGVGPLTPCKVTVGPASWRQVKRRVSCGSGSEEPEPSRETGTTPVTIWSSPA